MLCLMCKEPLAVGKVMTMGDYGMAEVEIKTHCPKCNRIFRDNEMRQNVLESIRIEMKGHLREYRQLIKKRDSLFLDQMLIHNEIILSNNNT